MSPTTFRGDLLRGDEWRFQDLRDRRVAIIASADQAARILPPVARTAASVKLFQSAATWVLPVRLPVPPGPLRRAAARLHLRLAVDDPWLRRQLTPTGGDQPVAVRPGFLAALGQPNCKLYTWPVYAICEHGVRSAEGVEHRVDVIIVGEGAEILGSLPSGKEQIA